MENTEKKFYKRIIEKEIKINSIYTIHYQALTKNYVSKEEKHDFYELIYADKENVNVVCGKQKFNILQGEMLFIKPNVNHYVFSGNVEPNIFIISFECHSKAVKLLRDKKISIKKENRYLLQEIMKEAEQTFYIPDFNPDLNELKFKEDRKIGGLLLIANYLEILLTKAIRLNDDSPNTRYFISNVENTADLKDEIITYLNEHIYDRFSLLDLCEYFHYKKSFLCSYFYKATGNHIYQTYLRIKTDEAKKLIRENVPLTEIAEKLKFDTPSYFYASFKKNTGLTPTEYKQSIK